MSNCVKFPEIFKKITDFHLNFKSFFDNIIPKKDDAYQIFSKNFMFIKFITFVIGILLILINLKKYKNLGLLASDIPKFIRESFVFALSGALPFLLVAYLRNEKQCTKNIFFMGISIFILFFIINFMLELSGFYSFVFGTGNIEIPKSNIKNDRQYFINDVSYIAFIALILLYLIPILSMVFSVFIIRNTNPQYNFNVQGVQKVLTFLGETLGFSILSAFPIFLISRDHGDYDTKKTTEEFFIVVAKFSLIHIILQLSGFYDNIFRNNPQSKSL